MPQMGPMSWMFLSVFSFLNMFILMIYLNSLMVDWKVDSFEVKLVKLSWNWSW